MFTRLRFCLLLLIAIVVTSFIFHSPLSSFYSSSSFPSQKRPVHLLIVSSWRSGSSFVGQILNHHDDVFYLFEPGHAIWMKFNQETAELLHYPVRDLLRSLFTCDVSPLRHYLRNGGQKIQDLGFFSESRALCSSPVCSASIPTEGYDPNSCSYRCGNASLEKMREACKSYSHVVMKTVRILDLSVLLPLFRDSDLDLRILHLVRDPRAVAASRKRFGSIFHLDDPIVLRGDMKGQEIVTMEKVMAKICKAQVNINKWARAAGISQQGRYMVIRHEDLSLKPLQNAERIYKFAGLSMTKDLERWIYNITHNENKNRNDFMAFSRKATKVVQKWRTLLELPMVKTIQHDCQEAMELFGYLPVKSKKEMNNLNVTLGPLEADGEDTGKPPLKQQNHESSGKEVSNRKEIANAEKRWEW